MVLQTLDVLGPLHGYGIARRIEQLSGNEVLLNQGTIYAALVRLHQRGWIAAEWGVSDTNRTAKFYVLTKAGKRQMKAERTHWERLATVMGKFLAVSRKGG
jgi:PadR family transcriptional regulator PadR